MKEAEKTVEEVNKLGKKGIAIECDVTNSESVHDVVRKTVDTFAKVDILVNNAGCVAKVADPSRYNLATISEQEWDRIVDINLKGAFLFSREVVQSMKDRKSGVVIPVTGGLPLQVGAH